MERPEIKRCSDLCRVDGVVQVPKIQAALRPLILAAYGPIASHFRPRRHRFTAQAYRQGMIQRLQIWQAIAGREAA
jgi:hypothetical protein